MDGCSEIHSLGRDQHGLEWRSRGKTLKNKRLLPGVMVLVAVLLPAARSGAQHMNAKDSPCSTSAATSDLYGCFDNAMQKQDAALNAYYRRVKSVVKDDELTKLERAQRLWIQFRDANCDAEYELYGSGTAGPVVKQACLEAMTRYRVAELKDMYEWRLIKWDK